MQLGLIGLGKMGGNMAERIRRAGHEVVGYDRAPGKRDVDSLPALVEALAAPRVVWVMVPSGEPTRETVKELAGLLEPGDVIVDGGNSKYTDDQVHDVLCREKGIGYVDAGVSGGVWGLENGYALMVGGSVEDVAKVQPIFDALKPPSPQDASGQEMPGAGFVHAGPVGAGHFSKMVHNGIEYGMMQAYAEGFAIMQRKTDFDLDLHQVAEIWREGSVVRSWLLDLTAEALGGNPTLAGIAPRVSDSGEGRWTVAEAIDLDVSAPVITLSLLERLRSREADSFADKLLAAMRNQFGGHAIKPG